jgi:hypothetical protein
MTDTRENVGSDNYAHGYAEAEAEAWRKRQREEYEEYVDWCIRTVEDDEAAARLNARLNQAEREREQAERMAKFKVIRIRGEHA